MVKAFLAVILLGFCLSLGCSGAKPAGPTYKYFIDHSLPYDPQSNTLTAGVDIVVNQARRAVPYHFSLERYSMTVDRSGAPLEFAGAGEGFMKGGRRVHLTGKLPPSQVDSATFVFDFIFDDDLVTATVKFRRYPERQHTNPRDLWECESGTVKVVSSKH